MAYYKTSIQSVSRLLFKNYFLIVTGAVEGKQIIFCFILVVNLLEARPSRGHEHFPTTVKWFVSSFVVQGIQMFLELRV